MLVVASLRNSASVKSKVSVFSLLTRPMRPLKVSSGLVFRVEAMLGMAAKAIDPSSVLRFVRSRG